MEDDNEFDGDIDAEFLAGLVAAETPSIGQPRIQQPTPQRIQQPTPQRLDRAPLASSTGPRVVQPTPQAIASRSSGSSILVSPRQKGNPILTHLRAFAWEYSDIPADYILGLTTCALFLSLKYHRLHPEYIYNRIKSLAGKYNLRVLLVMVDIGNHEDSLKELSKTSLVNNVTVILCWSAAEAARYIELYKSYEHSDASAIKGVESKGYAEKMVDFVTVPRSINKTDAVSIVSAFGSIKAAVNARPEEINVISGWGGTKLQRWCSAVDEPFRSRKAATRGVTNDGLARDAVGQFEGVLERAVPLGKVPLREMGSLSKSGPATEAAREPRQPERAAEEVQVPALDEDNEDELVMATVEEDERVARKERARRDDELSGGIADALARLREKG